MGCNISLITRHIGRIVREHREHLKISIYHFSQLSGISAREIGKIEYGDANPKWSTVIVMARILSIDLGDLDVKESGEE